MSKHTEIGNVAEQYILDVLKSCPLVLEAWKCCYNSKCDIFYKLKDGHLRGLQVKHMGIRNTGNKNNLVFGINHLDKYLNGSIIVCISVEHSVGMAFIMSDQYQKPTAQVTLNSNRGIFNKLCKSLKDTISDTINMLHLSPIINDMSSLMTPEQNKERESTERFNEFCRKHGYEAEKVLDNSSATDLLVNGKKIQMKFASNSEDTNRTYSYKISLSRKNKRPYSMGDNDYYVIELGTHINNFMIIPEKVLYDKGYIEDDDSDGKKYLNVYPYDYVEERRKITQDSYKHLVKGNWTCDSNFWYNEHKKPIF